MERASSPVRAQTSATSASVPFVIQAFDPESTQSLPSRRARVRMLAGSDPASGSVRPKQPMAVPAAMAGSQRAFCSSEPKAWIGYMQSEPCTEAKLRSPESPRSSSCIAGAGGQVGEPGAAEAPQAHPEEPERGHLGNELDRERAGAEVVADPGQEALVDEAGHRLPRQTRLLGQAGLEVEQVHRGGLGHLPHLTTPARRG